MKYLNRQMRNDILIFLIVVIKKSTSNIYIYYYVFHACVPLESHVELKIWVGVGREWEVLVNQFKTHISIYKGPMRCRYSLLCHYVFWQLLNQCNLLYTVILRFTGPRFTVSLDITCLWCSNQPALITPFVQALAKKEGADKKRPADIRIMGSQYTSLQCWFFETWTEYNECQSDYREKCKEKLTRQIQISESLYLRNSRSSIDCSLPYMV